MATKALSTQELADFFGISRQALKKVVDNGTLSGRLLDKGFQFIESKKEGRKIVYYIEEIVVVPKETWDVYTKREFPRVRKTDALGDYCEERLVNQTIMAKDIAKKAGVTEKTVASWDNLLVEKGLMKYNGYLYFRLTPLGPKQITYQEYAEYWGIEKPTAASQELNNTISRLKSELKSIVEAEDNQKKDEALDSYGICIKVKSYLVHRFTEKYNELVDALNNRKG